MNCWSNAATAGARRSLGPWNVAILLVSASYGISFVFGTGELARTMGMASSLYAAAIGIGMLKGASFVGALATLCISVLLGSRAGLWLSALVGVACGALVLAGVALYESRADVTSAP